LIKRHVTSNESLAREKLIE